MTIIGFIPGPSFITAAWPDDRPARWCFGCRQRLPHYWTVQDEPPERHPTYYEPVPAIYCTGCGAPPDMGGHLRPPGLTVGAGGRRCTGVTPSASPPSSPRPARRGATRRPATTTRAGTGRLALGAESPAVSRWFVRVAERPEAADERAGQRRAA